MTEFDYATAYRIATDETVTPPKRKFYLLGLLARTTTLTSDELWERDVDALMEILDTYGGGGYLREVIAIRAEGGSWVMTDLARKPIDKQTVAELRTSQPFNPNRDPAEYGRAAQKTALGDRLDAARRAYDAAPTYENLCRLEKAETRYAKAVTR